MSQCHSRRLRIDVNIGYSISYGVSQEFISKPFDRKTGS